jgi:hypothetical protein
MPISDLSPLGPQDTRATFAGTDSFTTINYDELLCWKFDSLTQTLDSNCEKLKKLDSLDSIQTKPNQLEGEMKGVKISKTNVNQKIQEVEKSMNFINAKFEENKESLRSMTVSNIVAIQKAEKT